jgi:PAS domain S-box-containing protein
MTDIVSPSESITDRKRIEDTLRAAAMAVSSAEGDDLFGDLVRRLAQILAVDAALIAVYADGVPARMRTLAVWFDGQALPNFEYAVDGSPERRLDGREFSCVRADAGRELWAATPFPANDMDSYATLRLHDATGAPLGLIAVLNRRPFDNVEVTEWMLKIFGARATAEIERLRANAALRESEASYRAIFEASEDPIFVHDWETGAIIDVSPKAEEAYGYTATELRQMRVGDVSSNEPPYTEAEARQWIEKAKSGSAVRFEWRARHRDGHLMWHEVRLKPAVIAGRPRILAFIRDITANRAAEDALRASEAQYRAIFNASADALVLWNSRLERVDVNPAFERMYGVSRDAVISSRYPRDLPAEGVNQRLAIVQRTLAGENCHEEIESVRRNGERVQTEVRTIRIQHRGEPHVLAMLRDVTERRRAEQAVRASEQQYRAIFNASEDGLLLYDAGCRLVDVSDAFVAMEGFQRDELIDQAEPAFIPGELRGEFASLLSRSIGGDRCRFEARARRKDGSMFDVEIHGIPMQYQNRPHVLITVRDITARREAEERLRASESRYRLLFEMESDAIVVTDAETLDMLDANRAAEMLWGYSRDELLRLKATDLSAEKEATRSVHRDPHGSVSVPLRWHRKKDGTVFPVEISLNRFTLEGRKVALSAIRDITERRERDEAVARSEGRLRATVEAALDCVIGIDSRGNLIEFNPAAERAFGRRREDVLGKSLAGLIIPHDKRRAHEEGLVRFRETGKGPYIGRRIETTALRADGSEFPVELAISVARAGDDDLFIGYVRDISERKDAERRRAELEAQLRQAQKMEAIGHLTGGIAHDFNNLLTSIMGYVTLAAERSSGGDGKLASYLEQANLSCARARDLIQQMLMFSRGRRGEPRPLVLAPLLRDSIRLLRSSFPSTITLMADLDNDAPPVVLDPVQLEQVLMNLAINARDATRASGEIRIAVRPAGSVALVCTSCRKNVDGDMVELVVADDGPGIPPDVRERMFEPFFTTKEVGQGSGMGLATVHGIVHEHGGHIVVESAPGKGATFRVLLPALQTSSVVARTRIEGDSFPRATLAGRLAIIDDEASVAGFMQELLANWDLQATVFADARSALDAIKAGSNFDLVITDQTMPRMTGIEFAIAARALRPELPIVLYTGYSEQIAAADAERSGVAAVIRKPIDPSALLATLNRYLPRGAEAR